jgi:ribonuclease D
MLESPDIIKIGHSFSGDVRMLNQTYKVQISPQKLVGVEKMVKSKTTKGLKALIKEYFKLEFCKFNQVSAWFQRPLRKSQIHYAALDAVCMIPLYEELLTNPEAKIETEIQPEESKKKKKKKKNKGKNKNVLKEEKDAKEEGKLNDYFNKRQR